MIETQGFSTRIFPESLRRIPVVALFKRTAHLFSVGFSGCMACCAGLRRCRRSSGIGTLAWQGSEEATIHQPSLVRNLEERPGKKRIVLRHFDLDGMAVALADGELDLVATNPGHYVSFEAQSGITRIAPQVSAGTSNPKPVVGSAGVVREQRGDIQDLRDPRGAAQARTRSGRRFRHSVLTGFPWPGWWMP